MLLPRLNLLIKHAGPIDPIVNRGDENNLLRRSPSFTRPHLLLFPPSEQRNSKETGELLKRPDPSLAILLHRTKKLQNVGRIDEILLLERD